MRGFFLFEVLQLIETLAAKLGTTVEYLWAVLLKQAFVSATISVIFIAFTIICGIFLFAFHLQFSRQQDSRYSIYEESDTTCIVMGLLGIVYVGLFIGAVINVENVIIGYLNPEYWAVSQLLNGAK